MDFHHFGGAAAERYLGATTEVPFRHRTSGGDRAACGSPNKSADLALGRRQPAVDHQRLSGSSTESSIALDLLRLASPHSSLRRWFASLDRLEALKPVLIVPSHGPTGDAGFISGYRAYLIEMRDRTAAAKHAGQNVDQAVEAVTAALADRFPDRVRLGQAIRVAYAEAP
jgi:hypothetical protein